MCYLVDRNDNFAKMPLLPYILERLRNMIQIIHLLIHNRVNIFRHNCAVHFLELQARTNQKSTDSTDVGQNIKEGRLFLTVAADEANNRNKTVNPDRLKRLRHGLQATNLNNVINATTPSQLLRNLALVGLLFVVDDMVGTELFQSVFLVLGGGCRYEPGAGGFGKLWLVSNLPRLRIPLEHSETTLTNECFSLLILYLLKV